MDPDSNSIILQLVILLILIGVNAFFAMSEIAIVTFNDNKLKKLAEDMGVELPRGAAKALIIDRLTAVAVQIPAENEEGAQ